MAAEKQPPGAQASVIAPSMHLWTLLLMVPTSSSTALGLDVRHELLVPSLQLAAHKDDASVVEQSASALELLALTATNVPSVVAAGGIEATVAALAACASVCTGGAALLPHVGAPSKR